MINETLDFEDAADKLQSISDDLQEVLDTYEISDELCVCLVSAHDEINYVRETLRDYKYKDENSEIN